MPVVVYVLCAPNIISLSALLNTKHRIFVLIASLLPVAVVSAASETETDKPKKIFFAVDAQHGRMLNTHGSDIVENDYAGFDFRMGFQTDDSEKNVYDCLFRYPYYGVGYYMGNMNRIVLGNDKQNGFGKPAALYAFFGSPLYRGKRFGFNYDLGLGLSYNFNAYDPALNPYNILIGTRNNAYISLRLAAKYALPGRIALGAGLVFQHFSNGSFQKPNKGINLISANLSLQIALYKNREKSYVRFPVDPYRPTIEWYLSWSNGVRMLDTGFDKNNPKKGRRWYCTGVSSAVLVQSSVQRKFGAGLDFFYFDWGRYVIEYRAEASSRSVNTRLSDNMALGAYLTHEIGYKKFGFITDLGMYLTKRVGDNPSSPCIYERVGVRYRITSRLFAGVSIKAHLLTADYTEWTVGYSIVKTRPKK